MAIKGSFFKRKEGEKKFESASAVPAIGPALKTNFRPPDIIGWYFFYKC
jgi:hypothetical protein